MNLRRFVRTLAAIGVLGALHSIPATQAANLDSVTQLIQSGKARAALDALEPILKADPKDAQARFLTGILLTETDRIPDAIQTFNDLAKDHPELPEPHNNLAVLYAAQGRFDEARKSLNLAIRTNPSYAVAHENLGDLYAKLASMAYDQALQIDQANRSVATKLQLLRELFQPPKATNPTTNPTTSQTTPQASTTIAKAPKTETPAANKTAAIAALLKDWSAAWSRKDVDAYLAFYDAEFTPNQGLTREAWVTQRQARLAKPGDIEIGIDHLRIDISDDKARIKFRQDYKADHFKSRGYKVMELIQRNDGWKILREK